MKLKKALISTAAVVIAVSSSSAAKASQDPVPPVIKFLNNWGHTTRTMVRAATGYIPVSDKLSVGPIPSFVGFNTLEGLRIGLGASSTASLSPHLFVGGYGAYGFRDREWKYGTEVIWSIPPVRGYIGSFPVNALKFSYSYDTAQLGDNSLSAVAATPPFRFSLRRNEMILYKRSVGIAYSIEPSKITDLTLSAIRERFFPTRFISFGNLKYLDAWRVGISTGWTPGGDFYQERMSRLNTKPYAPELRMRLQWIKGTDGNRIADMAATELAAEKLTVIADGEASFRFMAHGSIAFGKGTFPFLPALPSAPYIMRRFGSFALLLPLELPADKFVDIHLNISDNGNLLRKIPRIKPLDWSLTMSVDAAAGSLTNRNNPTYSPDLPDFPYYPKHMLTWTHPYVEIGFGLDRILGIGRVEYVRRLSYTSNSGVRKGGIALGLDLTF